MLRALICHFGLHAPATVEATFATSEAINIIAAFLDVEAARLALEPDAEAPLVGETIKRHRTNTNSAELYFLFTCVPALRQLVAPLQTPAIPLANLEGAFPRGFPPR
jgi:hypothetical protein